MSIRDKVIEAMSRAYCLAEDEDPDATNPEDEGGLRLPLWMFVEPAMGSAFDAALTVLSNPDEAMLEAGCDTLNNKVSWRGKEAEGAYPCHMKPVFVAMLTAVNPGEGRGV